MNIDFSNFRKIEDGDKHAVLEHPSGHKLKIAKKGLSEQLRKQLDDLPTNLAKGGYAKFSQKFDPNMGSKASKPSKSSTTMPGNQVTASKAFTEPGDMGTSIPKDKLKQELNDKQYPDVVINSLNRKAPPYGPLTSEPTSHYAPCINPSCKSFGKSHPNCRCYGGNPEGKESHLFADGGEVKKEYYCDANRMHRKGCEYYAEGGDVQTSNEPDPAETPVNTANAESEASPMPMQGDADQEVPQSDMAQPTSPDKNTEQAPQAEPEQPMDQGQMTAQMDPYQEYQKNMVDTNQLMQNEANKFFSDVDQGHIQPKTMQQLFHDKSLPGKIGTLFGLIVAGGGAGLTHTDNAVLTTMQKEINNDLQAQETNQKNKQNFMQINGNNLMHLANAGKIGADTRQMQIAMSKAQANYYLYNQLAQQAGNLSNPQQAQKAQQTLALMREAMKQDNASAFAQAAGANALGNMLRGGGNTTALKTGLYGPEAQELGGDVEQKTIPGVLGTAARPVQQHDRDQIQAMNVLDTKLKDIQSFAKQHEGSLNPNVLAQGRQKAAELVNFYNQSIQGGVLTEGRLAWLDSQINKNPTTIFQNMLGNNAKLQEVQNSNSMRRDSLLKSYGFPINKPQTSGGSKPQGGASKSGRPIVYRNGKAYYQ